MNEATIWMVHVEMHRSPKYWERASGFLPESWTVGPGHRLYSMKGAVNGLYFSLRGFAKLIVREKALIIALHNGGLGPATVLPKA